VFEPALPRLLNRRGHPVDYNCAFCGAAQPAHAIGRAVGAILVAAALVGSIAVVGRWVSTTMADQPAHPSAYSSQVMLPFTQLVQPFGVALDVAGNLNLPESVAVDTAGNVYLTDNGNQRLLKLPVQ
jgi:serine/threonine-protein kinase